MQAFIERTVYVPISFIDIGLNTRNPKNAEINHILTGAFPINEDFGEHFMRVNIETGEIVNVLNEYVLNGDINIFICRIDFLYIMRNAKQEYMGVQSGKPPAFLPVFQDDDGSHYLYFNIQNNRILNWGDDKEKIYAGHFVDYDCVFSNRDNEKLVDLNPGQVVKILDYTDGIVKFG